jgi:hypothetical protein
MSSTPPLEHLLVRQFQQRTMACCPPPAQVFAQNLPKQHRIIYLLFTFQILKIKNDLKIKLSWVSWGIVEYNLIKRINFFSKKFAKQQEVFRIFCKYFIFRVKLKLINTEIFAL